MQSNQAYSKSLRKIINKSNPEQREVALYFERSQSTQKLHHLTPTLPSLSQNDEVHPQAQIRRKITSHKLNTQPSEMVASNDRTSLRFAKESKAQLAIGRQSSFEEHVDTLLYNLALKGEARVANIEGNTENFEKRRLKNLRIVTEQVPQTKHQKRRTNEQLEALALSRQIEREKRLRQSYTHNNPQVQKKVNTRWEAHQTIGYSKDKLKYYPLVDMRQQNEELLLNIPVKTEQYLRRLRQTVFHKAFPKQ